jgi:hypothetical protein
MTRPHLCLTPIAQSTKSTYNGIHPTLHKDSQYAQPQLWDVHSWKVSSMGRFPVQLHIYWPGCSPLSAVADYQRSHSTWYWGSRFSGLSQSILHQQVLQPSRLCLDAPSKARRLTCRTPQLTAPASSLFHVPRLNSYFRHSSPASQHFLLLSSRMPLTLNDISPILKSAGGRL